MKSFLFILAFLPLPLLAQKLHGKITNQKNQGISEAHILNLSKGNHTHSYQNGIFVLSNASLGDTLQVSHIGYQTKKLIISSLENIKIALAEKFVSLKEVVISPDLNALNALTDIDIQVSPVNSSQEVLNQIPGLFIGQHAGGGKAEQLFLRGFDIDHGTDIAITVDGLPVNMVSHAHGQGYADLHFVIPETIEKIDFGKGAYYAQKGNYNTAGYANLETKKRLNSNLLKMEIGQFDTKRMLGMFNLVNHENHNAYLASEYLATDGAFESSQNFKRLNLLGKYTGNLTSTDQVGMTFSHFTSKWDASGQIPQRAVNQGFITRFGAIDDTEGGQTSRTNLALNYDKSLDDNSFIKNQIFYSQYDFELYSNFTFFLEDETHGDQIKQQENRNIFGLNSEFFQNFSHGNLSGDWQAGVQIRYDESKNNELSRTLNRQQTLEKIQFGDIYETNFGAYLNANFDLKKWTITPAIRVDYFDFQYYDRLQTTYQTKATSKAIISPKLNILYQHSKNSQIYLKAGKGFHSNDTRVILAENGKEILPASYGFDAGLIWKPTPKLLLNMAYWYLFLEQEFVYVGDAGIVEPSGKTQRQGIDLSLRYQPFERLFWNLDVNYAHARSTEEEEGQNFIPLAPDLTFVSKLIYRQSGFYTGLNVRHLKSRPANEDNSIVAEGYTVLDWNAGYEWKKLDIGFQIQNLLDTEWNETQFATESRLQNEREPVEEIHFTPGTPFFMKWMLTYKF